MNYQVDDRFLCKKKVMDGLLKRGTIVTVTGVLYYSVTLSGDDGSEYSIMKKEFEAEGNFEKLTKPKETKEHLKEVYRLLADNPERDALVLVDTDLANMDYGYVPGEIRKVVLEQIAYTEERMWHASDEEEFIEDVSDCIFDEKVENGEDATLEEAIQLAQKQFEELEWKETIIMYIAK